MSIIAKVVAVVAPPESEEARLKARARAKGLAGKDDWLAMVLVHHQQTEAAFACVKQAADPPSRISRVNRVSTLLTGHSIPEEAAVYPALAKSMRKAMRKSGRGAIRGKIATGLLEDLPPMPRIHGQARAYPSRTRVRGKTVTGFWI